MGVMYHGGYRELCERMAVGETYVMNCPDRNSASVSVCRYGKLMNRKFSVNKLDSKTIKITREA